MPGAWPCPPFQGLRTILQCSGIPAPKAPSSALTGNLHVCWKLSCPKFMLHALVPQGPVYSQCQGKTLQPSLIQDSLWDWWLRLQSEPYWESALPFPGSVTLLSENIPEFSWEHSPNKPPEYTSTYGNLFSQNPNWDVIWRKFYYEDLINNEWTMRKCQYDTVIWFQLLDTFKILLSARIPSQVNKEQVPVFH